MIKNIIFDFGDIFINLDKEIIFREIERFGGNPILSPEMYQLNALYETGQISSEKFILDLAQVYPKATPDEIIKIWNDMLLDFPDKRLEFLEEFAQKNTHYLFLLSNTNALHIEEVKKKMGAEKFNRFRNSFEKFYLSHEIHLRKPNADIYNFVLQENKLQAEETLFIDDTKENTDAAEKLGIKCWNLQVGKEDIINLKTRL
ncbi:HAD family hydrolase [Maribacter sp. 2308TA10-17]|uniref:HAD family hydrolase n=1 Tax=Maribacter sp. 2308TA10-17 TaxID=3386276 RepID=UPI0039BCDEDA